MHVLLCVYFLSYVVMLCSANMGITQKRPPASSDGSCPVLSLQNGPVEHLNPQGLITNIYIYIHTDIQIY